MSYPAPGSPDLAAQVRALIAAAELPVTFDTARGFDHRAFVPMAVMWPEAAMPLVQLSLRTGLDPAMHLALGRALAPLRNDGVLIVGSGLSWRNLRRLGPEARDAHPRAEHLLPLMVALGAAEQEAGDCPYREQDVFGGTVVSSFRFGA